VATRTTSELHLRAQRWIGELSRALEKDKPGAAGGGSQPPTARNLAEAATLKAAGISTSTALRAGEAPRMGNRGERLDNRPAAAKNAENRAPSLPDQTGLKGRG